MDRVFAPNEVLPQTGKMLLLDKITDWSDKWIEVEVHHSKPNLFTDERGRIPSYVCLEYICQAAAAHVGLQRRLVQKPVQIAFVLGFRRAEISQPSFYLHDKLVIRAERTMSDSDGVGVYNAEVYLLNGTKQLIVSTAVKAIMPDDALGVISSQTKGLVG